MKLALRASRYCAGNRRRFEAKPPIKFKRSIPCTTQASAPRVSVTLSFAKIWIEIFLRR
jgi:hypothetical protein